MVNRPNLASTWNPPPRTIRNLNSRPGFSCESTGIHRVEFTDLISYGVWFGEIILTKLLDNLVEIVNCSTQPVNKCGNGKAVTKNKFDYRKAAEIMSWFSGSRLVDILWIAKNGGISVPYLISVQSRFTPQSNTTQPFESFYSTRIHYQKHSISSNVPSDPISYDDLPYPLK